MITGDVVQRNDVADQQVRCILVVLRLVTDIAVGLRIRITLAVDQLDAGLERGIAQGVGEQVFPIRGRVQVVVGQVVVSTDQLRHDQIEHAVVAFQVKADLAAIRRIAAGVAAGDLPAGHQTTALTQHMLTRELLRQELALFPVNGVAVGLGAGIAIAATGHTGGGFGGTRGQRRGLVAAVAGVHAQRDQRAGVHRVGCFLEGEIIEHAAVGVVGPAHTFGALAPIVAVVAGDEEAHLTAADVEEIAVVGTEGDLRVGRGRAQIHVVHQLNGCDLVQRLARAIAEAALTLAAVQQRRDRLDATGDIAGTIVEAEGIVVTTDRIEGHIFARQTVGVAQAEGQLAGGFFREGPGVDDEVAPRAFARHAGDEGFLHVQLLDDVAGEQIQRDLTLGGVGRRQRRAVQRRRDVATTQAANEHEATALHGHAGHADHRGRNVGITETRQLLNAKGFDDIDREPLRFAEGCRVEGAQHEHLFNIPAGRRGRAVLVAGLLGHTTDHTDLLALRAIHVRVGDLQLVNTARQRQREVAAGVGFCGGPQLGHGNCRTAECRPIKGHATLVSALGCRGAVTCGLGREVGLNKMLRVFTALQRDGDVHQLAGSRAELEIVHGHAAQQDFDRVRPGIQIEGSRPTGVQSRGLLIIQHDLQAGTCGTILKGVNDQLVSRVSKAHARGQSHGDDSSYTLQAHPAPFTRKN